MTDLATTWPPADPGGPSSSYEWSEALSGPPGEVATAPVPPPDGGEFDETGREIAAVLRAAQASADEILKEARTFAERLRTEAGDDARRLREVAALEAQEDLQRIATEADSEAAEQYDAIHSEVHRAFSELAAGAVREIRDALQAIEDEQRQLHLVLEESDLHSLSAEADETVGAASS